MERKALRLLFALITAGQVQNLLVFQHRVAQGSAGGSITLQCSYSSSSVPKVGSFYWLKAPDLKVQNDTQEFLGRVTLPSEQDFLLERRADIIIQDLRCNDSGIYHCVVDIPGQPETSGNGTELQVLKKDGSSVLATPDPKSIENGTGSRLTMLAPLVASLASAWMASLTAPLIFL